MDSSSVSFDNLTQESVATSSGIVAWFNALSTTHKYLLIGGSIAVLCLIGYAGWRWYKNRQAKSTPPAPATEESYEPQAPRSPKKKSAKKVAFAPSGPSGTAPATDKPVTEEEFEQGMQMIDKTNKLLENSIADLNKTKQELVDLQEDSSEEAEENKKKLTGRIQYNLNFIRGFQKQMSRVGPLLLQDARTLGKTSPEITEKINSHVQSIEQNYNYAVQVATELNIPLTAPASQN